MSMHVRAASAQSPNAKVVEQLRRLDRMNGPSREEIVAAVQADRR
ncbi:MAG: hypothetical protein Q4D96_02165 [Propionibacteriaceae bacterium]|nr:hypothetical protein [Propionibacteriaceae bacterium]